jgi:hypothetical protein
MRPRYRIVEIRGCCSPCFGAKCAACGSWLTKHDYTAEDAAACAQHALDYPGHFQHICPKTRDVQMELSA